MKKFLIKVNGNQYEVEVVEIGGYTVQPVQAQAPVQAAPAPAPAPAPASAPAPAPARTEAAAPQKVATGTIGSTKVTAPMPGTILRIEAKVGDKVTKGQVLLILEAMKMENEIVAPVDGTVASINVESGASVNAGDLLASLS